jgi:zinc-binding in reverse transcriptase
MNLKKRGWSGNVQCVFCVAEETTDHLFVSCSYIQYIWRWITQYNNFIFLGIELQDI